MAGRRSVRRLTAGLAALAGGGAWVVKSAAILLTGDQPPVLFDLAPPLLGLSLWLLADPAERLARALGATATLTGAVGFLGEPWDNLLLVWALSLLVGLVLLRPRSPDHRFARLVGVGTVPALFLGGLLGLLRPDLVEVGLLLVGLAWTWLGVLLLRTGDRPRVGTTHP